MLKLGLPTTLKASGRQKVYRRDIKSAGDLDQLIDKQPLPPAFDISYRRSRQADAFAKLCLGHLADAGLPDQPAQLLIEQISHQSPFVAVAIDGDIAGLNSDVNVANISGCQMFLI
jgi:hypothetical protein